MLFKPKHSEPPGVAVYSKRLLRVAAGTGRSCIACLISYAKATL